MQQQHLYLRHWEWLVVAVIFTLVLCRIWIDRIRCCYSARRISVICVASVDGSSAGSYCLTTKIHHSSSRNRVIGDLQTGTDLSHFDVGDFLIPGIVRYLEINQKSKRCYMEIFGLTFSCVNDGNQLVTLNK